MNYDNILAIALKNKLPSNDIKLIHEYLEYNEWGIAFEVLCSAIESDKINISLADFEEIKAIGKRMNIDEGLWINIIPLYNKPQSNN